MNKQAMVGTVGVALCLFGLVAVIAMSPLVGETAAMLGLMLVCVGKAKGAARMDQAAHAVPVHVSAAPRMMSPCTASLARMLAAAERA